MFLIFRNYRTHSAENVSDAEEGESQKWNWKESENFFSDYEILRP